MLTTIALYIIAAFIGTIAGVALACAPAWRRNLKAQTKSLRAGVVLKDEIDKRTALYEELMADVSSALGVVRRRVERTDRAETKADAQPSRVDPADPARAPLRAADDPRLNGTPRVVQRQDAHASADGT